MLSTVTTNLYDRCGFKCEQKFVPTTTTTATTITTTDSTFCQGDALNPGEVVEGTGRFLPADGASLVFVKLANERGWVPMSDSFGVIPAAL